MIESLEVVNYPNASFFQVLLKGLLERGVDATVVSMRGIPNQRTARDYLAFAREIRRAHRKKPRALVHAHHGLSGAACLMAGIRPDIVTFWGSELVDHSRASRLVGHAARVRVVMSKENLGLLRQRASIIPHGIDTERFRPRDRAQARDLLGWPQSGKVVLFPYDPSRKEKRYGLAAEVVSLIQGEPPRLTVVKGISHDTMPSVYAAADALLLTSAHEGLPNAIKEALACELPIVATPVGDLPELLAGIHPGGIAADAHGLAAILSQTLASGRPANGREKAIQEFSLERKVGDLIRIYERVQTGELRRVTHQNE